MNSRNSSAPAKRKHLYQLSRRGRKRSDDRAHFLRWSERPNVGGADGDQDEIQGLAIHMGLGRAGDAITVEAAGFGLKPTDLLVQRTESGG